jgi:hypothetical protein
VGGAGAVSLEKEEKTGTSTTSVHVLSFHFTVGLCSQSPVAVQLGQKSGLWAKGGHCCQHPPPCMGTLLKPGVVAQACNLSGCR